MANAHPIEVDGVRYAGKAKAAFGLHRKGWSDGDIAKKIGSTLGAVKFSIRDEAKKAAAADPAASPGIWTPEKRDKVRRLFGLTMIEIANAVQVPPAELLTYVLHGVVPPSQAVRDPNDIRWTGDAPQLIAAPADYVEVEPEPDRDDDEAELAALQANEAAELERQREAIDSARPLPREVFEQPDTDAEVAPPASRRFQPTPPAARKVAEQVATGVVRLIDETGRFLHESLDGMTTNPRFAWKGDAERLKIVQKRLPHTRQLDVVPVHP